jgi:hypothetical protein
MAGIPLVAHTKKLLKRRRFKEDKYESLRQGFICRVYRHCAC